MLRDVPEGWRTEALSELASYINGRAFKPTDWSTSGLPIIRIANMTNPEAVYNLYPGDDLDDGHLVYDGDILFSWSATLSIMKWSRGPGILNQHIFKVVPAEFVHPDWLLYVLQNEVEGLAGQSHGSTMKHIKKGVLKTHIVALPPLHEQRRIAEILSSVDDAIAATRAVMEQTRKVKQGVLERLLTSGIGHTRFKQTEIGEIPEGWEVVQLHEIAAVRTGMAKNKKEIADPVELPYLRVANVQDGYVDLADLQTIRVSRSQVERYRLMKGDVLMTEGGDYDKLGRGDVWDASVDPCLHQNHVFAVRADRAKILPEFLALLTASKGGKAYFQSCSKQTTNLASINSSQVKEFPVRLPALAEQREIVAIGAVHQNYLNAQETDLAAKQRLKSSLMSDLITGRKRVTDTLLMAAE
ncbi:restriction endonuclease S subunit [Rhizobium sp. CF122]|uniref:restriction endonuclease subunit S n=1 Tax=Rhizobium sp. CF122 TaxID=1144312 RepID=UPI000271CAE0|nr:restriction endonuclease subunit S [Rhizobium sp. CF122]EJL53918.1 restriction endonuclease S subunit [Rhizobium sp. CF122]